jgi:hypothetical protein
MLLPRVDVEVRLAVDLVACDLTAVGERLQPSRDCREGLARVVLKREQVGHDQLADITTHAVVVDVGPQADEEQARRPVQRRDILARPELGLDGADPHQSPPANS